MSLIFPDWPAPANVRACSTTRAGGVSRAPWDALNLGDHVGDCPQDVQRNRERVMATAGLPARPVWMKQVHGTRVLRLTDALVRAEEEADAAWSDRRGVVCAAMTADCLPVLFCSLDGKEIAAAHAGWRGLCAGVLENTIDAFRAPPQEIVAWLGPSIGPDAFEVGPEVREAFMTQNRHDGDAFRVAGDKYFADIWQLARARLTRKGVAHLSGGGLCTVSAPEQFFSFRRDGITGRMASFIWLV